MRRLLISLLILTGVLAYQNCGSGFAPLKTAQDPVLLPAPHRKAVIFSKADRLQFGTLAEYRQVAEDKDPSAANSAKLKVCPSLSAFDQKLDLVEPTAFAFELDMDSLRISDAQSGEELQGLGPAAKETLEYMQRVGVLASYEEATGKGLSEDMYCAEIYTYPYAAVVIDGATQDLSIADTPCETRRDLFDSQTAERMEFEKFTAELAKSLIQRLCY